MRVVAAAVSREHGGKPSPAAGQAGAAAIVGQAGVDTKPAGDDAASGQQTPGGQAKSGTRNMSCGVMLRR
eukprot:1869254-Alexandrium_andersonii.AAC.1